mgnify:CR=1 FL=1
MVQTILLLAANPKDTGRLRLDQELRDIAEGLQRAQKREQFILEQRLAVRPRDIQRAMLDVGPQMIHFSGHGEGEQGLVFEDETGNTKLVDGEALAGLFALFADQIICVVLNGCYSAVQAKAISQHIPYVIGMHQAIGDKAAIAFSVGFYDALGAGRSIEFAYKLGCSSIRLEGVAEHLTPVIFKKPETKPSAQLSDQVELQQPKPQELLQKGLEKQAEEARAFQKHDRFRHLEPLSVFRDLDFSPEMVMIPSDRFLMGALDSDQEAYDDEKPSHCVTILCSFAISKYLVTFDEFDAFCHQTSRHLPSDEGWGRQRKPVINVSWDDAVAYTAWLSKQTERLYRLPTEAEWEYACRADTTGRYYCGTVLGEKHANIGTGKKYTTDVGSYPANPWGLYDMYGNVWGNCSTQGE